MNDVFGVSPEIKSIKGAEDYKEYVSDTLPIICVSADKGDIAGILQNEGIINIDDIKDKRETYIFKVTELPDKEHKDASGSAEMIPSLVIVGSDKRGTVYGMLHLSELMGVSPFTDWLDIKPKKLESVILTERDDLTSKEPSVRYRGFFINDEWPAFGNWCNKRFGGFNVQCYEHIFEMLLRLKGNYMWPAMWSSIFPDDGPGLASAELADKLGVVMGMSHHEPCLRQGEEYKYLRGPESVYGDAWDF
ncbi:MAG: glycosyl hydrolase 115 family protein, partial [Lachnospiraceae bacterium]|nr:glycosyl hydrolase 115 family protein [Lachnospiraceae bacterium]